MLVIGLRVITFDPAQHLSHWLALMTFLHVLSLWAVFNIFEEILSREGQSVLKPYRGCLTNQNAQLLFVTVLCVVTFNPAEQYLLSRGLLLCSEEVSF